MRVNDKTRWRGADEPPGSRNRLPCGRGRPPRGMCWSCKSCACCACRSIGDGVRSKNRIIARDTAVGSLELTISFCLRSIHARGKHARIHDGSACLGVGHTCCCPFTICLSPGHFYHRLAMGHSSSSGGVAERSSPEPTADVGVELATAFALPVSVLPAAPLMLVEALCRSVASTFAR